MKIFGGDLTETSKSWMRMIIFGVITVVAIITAALSSFMLTESGSKEHNWWVFLMVITWLAVGGAATATGFAIKAHRDLTKRSST
jgi:hypothetical protein